MVPPPNQQSVQVLALCISFTVLATITVFARLFTRVFIVKNVGNDDYVMFVSWMFAVVCGVMIILQAENGLGHHLSELTTEEFSTVLRFFYWSIPFYYASLSLSKFTIVFQTLRFVSPSQKRSRLACYIMIGVIFAYLAYTLITTFTICIPASFFWDKSIEGSCLNFLALWFVNAALNIVTDIAVLVIPLRIVLAIQLPKAQKIWLVLVFAIGGIVCISSILRLQSLYIVSVSKDPTFDNVAAAYWSDIEMNLAIICSNCPTLRPLLSRCFSTFQLSSYGPRSRLTGQRPPSTPGMLNSPRMNTRSSMPRNIRLPSNDDDGDFPLREIMVTTEIKQDFTEHEKELSIDSRASPTTAKDHDFV